MKVLLFAALLAATFLTACVVPTREGPAVIAPPLPPVVEFETDEPYYYYGGYYYYYNNNNWYYSHERRAREWHPLPRDRYPREWRYKHRGDRDEHGGGWERH